MIPIERLEERQYKGDSQPNDDPITKDAYQQTEPYIAPPNLRDAVNMALYLRRPLLIEGEPGTGKTRLAYSVATELGYPLKEIYIRSTDQAEDLLYKFDAVRRLYAIQERAAAAQWIHSLNWKEEGHEGALPPPEIDNEAYVKLGQLGEAIELSQQGTPSVVLIDEIDKADIDFPNDLLLVLDQLQFTIPELDQRKYDALNGQTREERRHHLPLVIITSNREKELPAPFLRRCLFYFIPFPGKPDLGRILQAHFQSEMTPLFTAALNHFWDLRDKVAINWRKAPSTSELLDWVRLLEANHVDGDELTETPAAELPYLNSLLKTQSDLDALANYSPLQKEGE
ncbi:MAG: MoxR family ATPase [Chloroflexota bacterium]